MILNEQQSKVVYHPGGPLLVLACPGSGKTRCITERILYLIDEGVQPRNILAVTFTNKAADEMAQRVKQRGYGHNILISTFHSLCVKILRQCGHIIGYKRNFSICDDPESLLRKIIKGQGHEAKDEFDPKRLAKIIDDKKNLLLDDAQFEMGLDERYFKIFQEYQKTLKASNAMDFGDLIYNVAVLLREKPEIRKAYATRFSHILVDEMQDTNKAQLEIAKQLASVHNNIILVGDADQNIYSWRGASSDNILKFDQHFPNSQTTHLSVNYRSTPEILEVSERLINKNAGRKMIPLKAVRSNGDPVQCLEFASPEEEAEEIANLIQGQCRNGTAYKEMAILCRINSLTRVFEETFRRREIPYTLIGAFGFYDRKEVKTGIAYMKFLANPEDAISFEEIVNTPSRGVGPSAIVKILEHAEQEKMPFLDVCKYPENVKGLSKKIQAGLSTFATAMEKFTVRRPSEALAEVFEETGFLPFIRKTDAAKNEHREDNVRELLRSFDNYCNRKARPTLEQYLQEVMLLTSGDQDSQEDSVRLMTVHAAKGLEFESVFIPGMIEGIFPHKRSILEGSLAEERRVCYVAATRAKNDLCLTRSSVRLEDSRMTGAIPSRFLEDMGQLKIDWDKSVAMSSYEGN